MKTLLSALTLLAIAATPATTTAWSLEVQDRVTSEVRTFRPPSAQEFAPPKMGHWFCLVGKVEVEKRIASRVLTCRTAPTLRVAVVAVCSKHTCVGEVLHLVYGEKQWVLTLTGERGDVP